MGEKRLTENGAYSVVIIDMFHYDDGSEYAIRGFPTFELARQYARCRTRDSIEEFRGEGMSHAEIRRHWFTFGEDCVVGGGGYAGGSEIDYFIDHPATAEERDWVSLEKRIMARQSS